MTAQEKLTKVVLVKQLTTAVASEYNKHVKCNFDFPYKISYILNELY